MSLEKQLTEKQYYSMFINEHEVVHPIRVLGDAYQEEMQKGIPDLSYIRFAQGEVYFHNRDFETAIFKWGNIINELEPWAQKIQQMLITKWGCCPMRRTCIPQLKPTVLP